MTSIINELEAQLAASPDFHQRIDALNKLATILLESDPRRALLFIMEALDVQDELQKEHEPYVEGRITTMVIHSQCSLQQGSYDVALTQLFSALIQARQLDSRVIEGTVLDNIGQTYLKLGDYSSAIEYLMRALDVARQLNDQQMESSILNNLGFLYAEMDEPEEALYYLHSCLDLSSQQHDRIIQVAVLDNLSRVQLKHGNVLIARDYANSAIELSRALGMHINEAEALNSLGDTYFAEHLYPEAERLYQKALALSQRRSHNIQMIASLLRIGKLHLRIEDHLKAEEYLRRALALANPLNDTQAQYECHQSLAIIEKQRGHFQKAIEHLETFHTLQQARLRKSTSHRVEMLRIRHDTEVAQQKAEINHLRDVALDEEIREREIAEASAKHSSLVLEEQIEERDQLISDLNAFAHSVAHDLKTPLGLVLGYADLATMDLEALGIAETYRIAEHVDMIKATALSMNRIITEMLLLARIRQHEVPVKVLDMGDILLDAESRLSEGIATSGAILEIPETWPAAMGYAPWVEEVWVNYISNAIKYGGEPPIITFGATREQDGQIRYWLRDNGDGITPEAQVGLFKPFNRLTRRHIQGHGLGLSIVKRIIEKLGGTVGVESECTSGMGCRFSFTLPGAV